MVQDLAHVWAKYQAKGVIIRVMDLTPEETATIQKASVTTYVVGFCTTVIGVCLMIAGSVMKDGPKQFDKEEGK